MWTKFDNESYSPTDGCYCTATVSNSHAEIYDQEMNDNPEDTVRKILV